VAAAAGGGREWFFDTELLVSTVRAGLRVHEVLVDRTDDPEAASTSSRPPLRISGGRRPGAGRLTSGRIPLEQVPTRLGLSPWLPDPAQCRDVREAHAGSSVATATTQIAAPDEARYYSRALS
jgi:hypothetical protein